MSELEDRGRYKPALQELSEAWDRRDDALSRLSAIAEEICGEKLPAYDEEAWGKFDAMCGLLDDARSAQTDIDNRVSVLARLAVQAGCLTYEPE